MFDDDDPVLARVRDLALAMPGAQEKVSHGRPAFFTKKVFCYYGGSVKVGGEYVQHPQCIVVLAEQDERRALIEMEQVFLPAYLAPSGWIGVDLDDSTDWTEVAELLDSSYRVTAPKRLVGELDEP
jgi:predicted DNA-binding protein (MmcQ/YjbR family)